jgi:hypothetical protein
MEIQDCVPVSEACRMLDTYDRLLKGLAVRNGIEIQKVGHIHYINRKDIEGLRQHVQAWKNRPRLAEILAAATAS